MTGSGGVEVEVLLQAIPVLEGVWDQARANMIPGGTLSNLDFVSPVAVFDHGISKTEKLVLCDAQTSGGLLISVPGPQADALVDALHSGGVRSAARIGKILKTGDGTIYVRK
jgi:selenide,water dikinase